MEPKAEVELVDARLVVTGEELAAALAVLADEKVPWETRAAIYQTMHQLQLEVNRVLRKAKAAIVYAMDRGNVTRAGRIKLKWKPKDVRWPCNEAPAWEREDIQAAFESLRDHPVGRLFVTAVPRHLELDTAFLGIAMANPSAIPESVLGKAGESGVGQQGLQEYARELWAEANRAGWRVEVRPEPTLEIEEVKR